MTPHELVSFSVTVIAFGASIGTAHAHSTSTIGERGQLRVGAQPRGHICGVEHDLTCVRAQIAVPERADKSDAKPRDSWESASEWRSVDGSFSFKPRVGIDLDAAVYDSEEGTLDYESGVQFRRARLGVIGRAYDFVEYKLEGDFANGTGVLKDAYIVFEGGIGSAQIGHFRAPFTIGDKNLWFMERSTPANAFRIGRKVGAALTTQGTNWTTSIGAFGDAADESGLNEGGWSINARAAFAPLLEEWGVLHFGAASYYQEKDDGVLRLSGQPEVSVDNRMLVSTGDLPLDHARFIGLEAAGMLGAFAATAEWGHLTVARPDLDSLSFDGGAVSFSHLLSGERQQYRGDLGAFTNIEPVRHLGNGGVGTWEVAMRYSWLDLRDQDIEGGVQRNITLALNWYFLPGARLLLTTTLFDIDDTHADPPISGSGARVPGDLRGAVHALRLEMSW